MKRSFQMFTVTGNFATGVPSVKSRQHCWYSTWPELPRSRSWLGALFFLLAFFVMTVGIDPAYARNNYVDSFTTRYPLTLTDDNVISASGKICQMCHESPQGKDGWNAYGWAMRLEINGGADIATAILNVENIDSDGNGDTNLAEINADAQPGWVPGANNTFYFKNLSTTSNNLPPAGLSPLDPATGNTPPAANNDSDTVAEGGSVPIDVVANDTDVDGAVDATTVTIVTDVTNGSTVVNPTTGVVTYTHDGSETVSDSFTYTVQDNLGATSNTATVTITVTPVNDPPVANNDTDSVVAGNSVDIDVVANDTDVDGTINATTVTIIADVSNGTTLVNPTTGVVTYTHDGSATTSDSFTYTVQDNQGATSNIATANITVTGPNNPPVANNDSDTVAEGGSVPIDVVANDTDSDGTVDATTVTIIADVSNGTTLVNPTTGVVTYTHDGSETVSDNFTYTVQDNQGATSNTATVTITVTPVNDPPVANNDSDTVAEGGSVPIDVVANDTDVDGTVNATTVTIVADVTNGSTAVNPTTGVVTYTHDGSETTSDSFTYTVNDNDAATSNTATVTITVTPVNDPPVANNDSDTVAEGGSVPIDVVANDTDVDGTVNATTVTIVADVTNGSTAVNPTTGVVTYTHDGSATTSDSFTYTVNDNSGATSNIATVNITITAASNEPTIQASNLVVDLVASKSMYLKWTAGNGDGSIVVMRLQSRTESAPVDGTDYAADNDFSIAPETVASSDNFVVYKGTSTELEVHGLETDTLYTVSVYAYGGVGAGTDYLQLSPATLDRLTNGLPMHNLDHGAGCFNCHANHGNTGLVPRQANQQTVCETCHNSESVASAKLNFALHTTPTKAADDVDCGSCHEVHKIRAGGENTTQSTHPISSTTANNLSFIRANVDKYITTATVDDAVYHTAGEDLAIEGGDETTSRGICQSCHSDTSYHQHAGGSVASQCHKGGSNDTCDGDVTCTSCHAHDGNFHGQGGDCIGCHQNPQGGTPPQDRRAIVSEFSRPSSHIDPGQLIADDCEVCHAQEPTDNTHVHGPQTGSDKRVTLWNADDHGTSYQLGVYADPAATYDSAESDNIDAHCLSCHDADGADAEGGNRFTPFTGSGAPPNIAATWSASSHGSVAQTGNGTGEVTSCFGDGSFGCHGSGHGSELKTLLAPATTPISTPFSEEREAFCLNCHTSGGESSLDINAQFNGLTYDWLTTGNNGGGSPINGRHDVMPADQDVSGGLVTCKNCHSPHADNDAYPAMLDPDDHATVLGDYSPTASYVTPVGDIPAYNFTYNNGTNLDPVNPEGLGGSGRTEPDYIDFCLTCHDGTTPPGVVMPTGMIDIAGTFRDQDHHGRITGGDAGQGYLKYPWTTNGATSDPTTPYASINCTVCHGPHGSENIFNLRESITVAGVQMRVGGWTGDDIGNPRAPYDCSTPGDPATCSTTYILPPMDGRNINDATGEQADHYWGAWCSFCHQMESHGQAEDNKCRQGHMHGGGNF